MVYTGIGVGLLLSLLGELTMEPICRLMGASDAMLPYCLTYGRILMLGLTPFVLQNMFQTLLVAAEKPRLGLWVTVAAGVTNMGLDYLFMGPLHWGIAGAAWATMLSACVGGLLPLLYFAFPNSSLYRLGKTRWDGGALRQTCWNGLSEFVTNISLSLINMLYNWQLMRIIGEDGVAAYGVIQYVAFFFVAIFIGFSVVCVGLLAIMRDLGTALIFFVTFLLIAFMRSGDFKTIILAVSAAVFGAVFAIRFMPYVANRFKAYRHVWEYAQDTGYQQTHVLTFIASGGLFGVGVGNGFLKQVAASESDLVFGLVAEEMGIIVAITLALAVALLVVYARAITTRSRSTFYSISACCAAGLLVVQLTLNIFGATDLLPLTGVTFPFISAGGSSIIGCWGLISFIKAADERTYSIKR